MSTKQDRDLLKTYFETGDRPTEEQFERLIDSGINQVDDQIDVSGPNKNVGIGKVNATRKLHVAGKTFVGADSNAVPSTGNAFEVNAGLAHGIAVSTEGNDVFNFLDLGQPLNPNPFTFTDNAGRGFRFYKNVAGGSGNGELMRIAKNGNVGVGPIWSDAQARLEVLGSSDGANSDGIIRVETPDKTSGANLRMGALSGDYSWIQAHGNKPLHINKVGNNTLLNETDGNVGVGVSVPGNKLHLFNGPDQVPLQNSSSNQSGGGGIAGKAPSTMVDNDTGLRLQTGSQSGHILVSDSDGNAYWKPPTVVTNGLWIDNGNGSIRNGNSGNVGVGTSSPSEKLHVDGNIKVDGGIVGHDQYNKLNIGVTGGSGGAYISLRNNDFSGGSQGGMIFGARRGANATNGFTFLQYNPGESSEWPRCLSITGQKNSHFWDNGIFLRSEGDKNHGLAFFGATSAEQDRKNFDSINVDGPVLFGHSGGALGSRRGSVENTAMRWFESGNVDFQGEIKVKNNKLIVKRRVDIQPGSETAVVTGFHPDDWDAVVTNFQWDWLEKARLGVDRPTHGETGIDKGTFKVMVEPDSTGTKFIVSATFPRPNQKNTTKRIDVLFIRREILG